YFQAEDGIRDRNVTGVQTCALPIYWPRRADCYAARMGDVDRLVSAEPQRETPAAELLPLVYEELRRLAAAKMAREPSGDTFQARSEERRVGKESRTWSCANPIIKKS